MRAKQKRELLDATERAETHVNRVRVSIGKLMNIIAAYHLACDRWKRFMPDGYLAETMPILDRELPALEALGESIGDMLDDIILIGELLSETNGGSHAGKQ